jgi:hypothetical protein
VSDPATNDGGMAVECVPFAPIHRVSIRMRRRAGAAVGFHQPHPPTVIAAETLLRAAVGGVHESG